MLRDGCDVSVTHDWHSPIHDLDFLTPRQPASGAVSLVADEHRRPLVLVSRFGGAPFDVSHRKDIILYGVDYYVDKAMELAAMRKADAVVFPSEWMRNWTCHFASFCDRARSLVVPAPTDETGLAAATPAAASAEVDRPVRSFAFVGDLDDRHGFGQALAAVCNLSTDLHVFGRPGLLHAAQSHAVGALLEAPQGCAARLHFYGDVEPATMWASLRRLVTP